MVIWIKLKGDELLAYRYHASKYPVPGLLHTYILFQCTYHTVPVYRYRHRHLVPVVKPGFLQRVLQRAGNRLSGTQFSVMLLTIVEE